MKNYFYPHGNSQNIAHIDTKIELDVDNAKISLEVENQKYSS